VYSAFMVNQQVAAIYTRLSKIRGGRSIAEQEQAGRETCGTHGWQISGIYTDSVSASRFARRGRPDWERLTDDLEAERFGVLVLWESSRGDRDPETWMALLRRCREHKIMIHVVSEDQTYDPARARDWKTLAESGIDSAYESEKISMRVKRSMAGAAIAGKPHGPVIYGYERAYDTRTGQLKEQRPHPAQAPVVAEIVRRLAAGEPISVVTDDLNRRKIPSPSGGQWTRSPVRKIGLNVAYLGKRVYKGEMYDAIWPPIVPASHHYACVRRFGEPGRKITRPGGQKYLLSYMPVVRCGVCSGPLKGFPQGSRGRPDMYGCLKGHTYAPMREMDNHVAVIVRGRMYTKDFREQLAQSLAADEVAVQARADVDELQARLDELAALAAGGEIPPRQYIVMQAELLPRIAAAEKRAAGRPLPAIPDPGDIYGAWEALLIPQRRDVVAFICSQIILLKPEKAGRQPFDGTRVEFEFRKLPGVRERFMYTWNDGDKDQEMVAR
jgi:site-specific DNA recombinase